MPSSHDRVDGGRRVPERPRPAAITRKRFLHALGTGSAAIAGYFLIPRGLAAAAAPSEATPPAIDAEPWLAADVALQVEADGILMTRGTAAASVACAVNEAGAEVVRRLDGRTSVATIARALAASARIEGHAEVEAKVACFVAQLGELGFLRAPFYAWITNGPAPEVGRARSERADG